MEFNRFGNMMPPEAYKNRPYLMYRDPFRIAGNLYFVGNEWCCSHLIDTGEGLILLDTPTASGLPGLIRNIYKLGFCLEDLKYIVVSHAHTDHFGCVQALVHMTGAKTFLGEVDARDMAENPERMAAMNADMGPYNECFTPDILLRDGDVIRLGNTEIRCVLTPGHTIGVMSHFWTLEDEGRTLHVGIYGGAGFISLSKEFLKNNGLPLSLRDDFSRSIEKVWDEPVDIMLGNHPFHNDTYLKQERRKEGGENPFIDPEEWRRFLQELKDKYMVFLEQTADAAAKKTDTQWEAYYSLHE